MDGMKELMEKRMRRAARTILTVKEVECDRYLPPEASQRLRTVVLDQLNDYRELCYDLISSVDTGSVVLNEAWLEKQDDIHEYICELDEGEGNKW